MKKFFSFARPDVCINAALVKTKHREQSLWKALCVSLRVTIKNNCYDWMDKQLAPSVSFLASPAHIWLAKILQCTQSYSWHNYMIIYMTHHMCHYSNIVKENCLHECVGEVTAH